MLDQPFLEYPMALDLWATRAKDVEIARDWFNADEKAVIVLRGPQVCGQKLKTCSLTQAGSRRRYWNPAASSKGT